MAKKIYDIFPPHVKREEKTKDSFRSLKKNKLFSVTFNFKKTVICSGILFLIFIITSHTIFLGAKIIIWPEASEAFYSGKVAIDSSALNLDFEENIIPGEIFEINEQESRIFFSSGKETTGKKAEGILKVYNNYSTAQQALIENTRFISADGKLFYSTKKIIIPGKREEGSKIIPGEIDVLVRAAEPGKEYNIERISKFSVPGLHGTALYTSIYAENLKPIIGGYIGDLPLITKQDIESARSVLITDVLDRAKLKLKEELSDDFIIENDLIQEEILDESFYPGIGENSESFEYSIRINLKIISFKESYLKEIVESDLLEKFYTEENYGEIFSGKEIFKESLNINFHSELINFREGKVTLNFNSSALIYSGINEDNFKKSLEKKKIKEVKTIMADYPEFSEFKINYWPFWVKSLPKKEKINLEIKIK